MALILAGDVGATKTLLALFRHADAGLALLREDRFASREHGSLEEILAKFLAPDPRPKIDAACFGVAGPVLDGACIATNLPWRLEETALAAASGARRVKLMNDVEAAAYGMPRLRADELAMLNPPAHPDRRGNIAVMAPGTGLGEAFLYWDGERHHPVATEGGHADFAPHSDLEFALLGDLRAKYRGHVSYERVLSGPGIHNIYSYLRRQSGVPEPAWLAAELAGDDPAPPITRAGLAGADPICRATLDLFAHILGVEAGNLALKCLAVAGVYLGGGIAPVILSVLQGGGFMRGFTDKGRFARLLGEIKVCVAMNTRAPLIGAAHFALRL